MDASNTFNEIDEVSEEINNEAKADKAFKKPVLIGKIGRLPRKISQHKLNASQEIKQIHTQNQITSMKVDHMEENNQNAEQGAENSIPLSYKEPSWSGLPKSNGTDYIFEVLKNGSIIETINLMQKSFWVFGRLTNCNICMQHPTISRYHAILQYRSEGSDTDGSGFYIFDLGSTHGTFLNKNRLKPKVYVRMQVGHMLKLGCSTRTYILNGPDYDKEEESKLTITELKQKRVANLLKQEEQAKLLEIEKEQLRKKEEERGVDWGLGEDADEETDLSENPYAQTTNEDLYINDPKKALRGFFEREGVDLEYNCSEQGMGQFLCKVELPLDDELGCPIIAEVLHKGKKKEAVVQCALEACRILDRYGVLRQATHESRKRKAKNWEENDYYDSDEDTFLDRTGTIEKKREKRMNAKVLQKPETYESLLEKEKAIATSITNLEKQLEDIQTRNNASNSLVSEEDTLDTFMKQLKDSKPDKQTISKLKLELTKLKAEHANIIHLVNITKPASLPPLIPQNAPTPSTSASLKSSGFPIIGKKKKIKVQVATKPVAEVVTRDSNEGEIEVEEEQEETEDGPNEQEKLKVDVCEHSVRNIEQITEEESDSSSHFSDESMGSGDELNSIKSLHSTMTFKKFENILKKGLPNYADKYQDKLEKILHNLKKLATSEDRMQVDWKILSAKKRKVMKLISDLRNCEPNEKLEHQVSSELNRILNELNVMTEQKHKIIGKVKKMGNQIKNISEAIDKDFLEYTQEIENSQPSTSSVGESPNKNKQSDVATGMKVNKRNQRRIQQRQDRVELARQRGYEEDAMREDYNMWVPPTDQTGDGRTSLNDKLGY